MESSPTPATPMMIGQVLLAGLALNKCHGKEMKRFNPCLRQVNLSAPAWGDFLFWQFNIGISSPLLYPGMSVLTRELVYFKLKQPGF